MSVFLYFSASAKRFDKFLANGKYYVFNGAYSASATKHEWSGLSLNQLYYTGECVEIVYLPFSEIKEILRLNLVKMEKIPEGESYYCFSNKISVYKIIDGKKINVHVFYGKDSVKIGSPIIYLDY